MQLKKAAFRRIGAGFCGTVWALELNHPPAQEYAFKREDGGPGRSLEKEYEMHKLVLHAMELYEQANISRPLHVSIPRCHQFMKPDDSWWSENLERFPDGYAPCNTLRSDRIPPVGQQTREILIDKFCPARLVSQIKDSDANRDCLIRPYLGRHRYNSKRPKSGFTAFSLRNFPLHLDQMEDLEIPLTDLVIYSELMAETLAILHWFGMMDANDVEFVLAPPRKNGKKPAIISNILGDHVMWILAFDCCNEISFDIEGVEQAVRAFFKNDPFYPRPTSSPGLWSAFRVKYIQTSSEILAELADKTLLDLPVRFIDGVESKSVKA
ncbi:uncharacterized protein GIQ15_06507 [Arthroderma uncinatum]|uniref:uncharacterized protein n=1 Tax=Arthroderma uncinatum TaxID=74035 RepID=UPI00144AB073|nr:uncharacterized protein GIQ15_06507 [Arthroderma uncinatum]KAF3479531.1 hypothetical protein GIQ15_06507 [Arthroderma uncinatum]